MHRKIYDFLFHKFSGNSITYCVLYIVVSDYLVRHKICIQFHFIDTKQDRKTFPPWAFLVKFKHNFCMENLRTFYHRKIRNDNSKLYFRYFITDLIFLMIFIFILLAVVGFRQLISINCFMRLSKIIFNFEWHWFSEGYFSNLNNHCIWGLCFCRIYLVDGMGLGN